MSIWFAGAGHVPSGLEALVLRIVPVLNPKLFIKRLVRKERKVAGRINIWTGCFKQIIHGYSVFYLQTGTASDAGFRTDPYPRHDHIGHYDLSVLGMDPVRTV